MDLNNFATAITHFIINFYSYYSCIINLCLYLQRWVVCVYIASNRVRLLYFDKNEKKKNREKRFLQNL